VSQILAVLTRADLISLLPKLRRCLRSTVEICLHSRAHGRVRCICRLVPVPSTDNLDGAGRGRTPWAPSANRGSGCSHPASSRWRSSAASFIESAHR